MRLNGAFVPNLKVNDAFYQLSTYKVLPPFQKSRNASPKSTVTRLLGSFLRMTTRRPVPMKGLRLVSSAMAHGLPAMAVLTRRRSFVGTGRLVLIRRKLPSCRVTVGFGEAFTLAMFNYLP